MFQEVLQASVHLIVIMNAKYRPTVRAKVSHEASPKSATALLA
jgi:hypothetical protein